MTPPGESGIPRRTADFPSPEEQREVIVIQGAVQRTAAVHGLCHVPGGVRREQGDRRPAVRAGPARPRRPRS